MAPAIICSGCGEAWSTRNPETATQAEMTGLFNAATTHAVGQARQENLSGLASIIANMVQAENAVSIPSHQVVFEFMAITPPDVLQTATIITSE